jgi:hypothetical protein
MVVGTLALCAPYEADDFPSPFVGEGGAEISAPDEGFVSADAKD